MFTTIYTTVLYQPLLNFFVWLYNVLPAHDVGLVIVIITIIIRLILYPLTASSLKAQKSMQALQPQQEEIKKLYPNDKQKQSAAIMELYKKNKVNPLTSCLPILLQLPLLWALNGVLRDALSSQSVAASLYPFIHNPGIINSVTLGLADLAKPSYVLAILAGAAQFWQARMMSRTTPPPAAGAGGKDEGMMASMNKQMLYLMPIMTVVIGIRFSGGLLLYWLMFTLLMIGQQYILFRKKGGPPNNGQPNIARGDEKVIEGTIVGK